MKYLITCLVVILVASLWRKLLVPQEKIKKLLLGSLGTTVATTIIANFIVIHWLGYSVLSDDLESFYVYLITNLICIILLQALETWLVKKVYPKHADFFIQVSRYYGRSQISVVVCTVVWSVSLLLYFSSEWLIESFGQISIEQLLFSAANLEGTDTQMVYNFLDTVLIHTLFWTLLYYIVFKGFLMVVLYQKGQKNKKTSSILLATMVSLVTFGFFFFLSINVIGVNEVRTYFTTSKFIEENYVDPTQVTLAFPERKRNLIYIFVESLEGTYASTENGGIEEIDLLSPLTDMTQEGAIQFSNSDKTGGAIQLPGLEYTAAGIVGQTSGMPIKSITIDVNAYARGEAPAEGVEKSATFLPGLYSLGQILEQQGYQQYFLMGSDSRFASRRDYLEQHGNYTVLDLQTAREEGWIPEDYYQWWGYEDRKLFEFARNQLSSLDYEAQPFNFTLLTADTHFPDGFVYEDTPMNYRTKYTSVIACSTAMIAEFVNWCKEQPFYENTTIVISGDHVSMDQGYAASVPDDYERNVFNLYINSATTTECDKNRLFSTMDLFPTTLSSLGVVIEDNRLALGTNLFSGEPTLVEKYPTTVKKEIAKRSEFYKRHIVDGLAIKPKT